MLRRIWLLGVPVGVVVAAVIIALARPWERSGPTELTVTSATLRPGLITLILANGSEEPAGIAQVIVNDAFIPFRASQHAVRPGDAERITVRYPWIHGEAYDIELMTSSGATVEYEIEEADDGRQAPEAA
jgi:hypothetical protein